MLEALRRSASRNWRHSPARTTQSNWLLPFSYEKKTRKYNMLMEKWEVRRHRSYDNEIEITGKKICAGLRSRSLSCFEPSAPSSLEWADVRNAYRSI
jgi:hypothetical protein